MKLQGLQVAQALEMRHPFVGNGTTAADPPKGGTFRIMSPDELDYVDPALGYLSDTWMVEYATCAKLFNHPDEAGAAGLRVVPEVVRSYTVSPNGIVVLARGPRKTTWLMTTP